LDGGFTSSPIESDDRCLLRKSVNIPQTPFQGGRSFFMYHFTEGCRLGFPDKTLNLNEAERTIFLSRGPGRCLNKLTVDVGMQDLSYHLIWDVLLRRQISYHLLFRSNIPSIHYRHHSYSDRILLFPVEAIHFSEHHTS